MARNRLALIPPQPAPGGGAQGYKDALRLSLNNQSMGISSPSDRSLRRNNRSPRSEGDRSPGSVSSSVGTGDGYRFESRRVKSSDRISLTKAMDKSTPPKKPSDGGASRLNGLLIASKSVSALILLIGGVILGALLITGSADWIFEPISQTSPLLSCPTSVEVIGLNSAIDGSSCRVRFSFDSFAAFDSSIKNAFQPYNALVSGDYQCFQRSAYTDCSADALCQVRCYSAGSCAESVGSGSCTDNGFIWGSDYSHGAAPSCTQTIALSGTSYPLVGASISAEPICGASLVVTPAMILTLRGELVGALVIALLVALGLSVKSKVAPAVRTAVTSQKGLMIAKASANELRSVVESRWDSEYAQATKENHATHNGPKFETGSLGGQQLGKKKDGIAQHPAKHFASTSWRYRVRVMQAMMKKRESRVRRNHLFTVSISAVLLLAVTAGLTVLLLSVLPGSYPYNTVIASAGSAATSWTGNVVSIFSPLYTGLPLAPGVWVDALTLTDLVLEFCFLFTAAVVGLRWQPLSSDRELKRLAQTGASEEACLVLMVSAGTCLRSKGRDKLVALVERGLNESKFGAVFVLDMGAGNAPLDDTWKIVSNIDPVAVHYVYLPDNHRRLAHHWLAQVWVPFLHKHGRIGRLFKQMVTVEVDAIGAWSLDAGTANKLLMIADGNVDDSKGSVILLPARCDGIDGITGAWEDARLKTEYYRRMGEAGLTNGLVLSMSPSDSVSIWDRRTVQVTSADPTQIALAAARRRGQVLASGPSGLERVPVHHSIYHLYCAQAERLPNGLSQIKEVFFTLSSLVHGPSLVLKVLITMGPLMGLIGTLLRPLVFGSLLFRDPLGLVCLLITFWVISCVNSALHWFSEWRGGRCKDLGPRSVVATILSYPVYQLYLGCMSLGLMVSGGTFGRTIDQKAKPSLASPRELYPCLPHPEVDWFTCWKTSDASRLSVLSSAVDSPSRSASGLGGGGAEAMV